MFEVLDRRTKLTANQMKILVAAIIGDALEFFDYFLIEFVLAFLIGPWKLTFGQSATVLMSSGIGAYGCLSLGMARRPHRTPQGLHWHRAEFFGCRGALSFTPDNGWIFLSAMRFFVGLGVGGLYSWICHWCRSSCGSGEWRLLFAVGVLPALLVLLVRVWVPESPRWLCRQGRYEDARRSLAWALQMAPPSLPMPTAADAGPVIKSYWLDLFKYPRSLIVSWLGNAGAQTGVYGITLWAPALFVVLLRRSKPPE